MSSFPVKRKRNIVSLGEEGITLLKASNFARKVCLAVRVSKALKFGAKTVVIASSGNAAASLAAYSAKAGFSCIAFVLEFASFAKIAQMHLYWADVIKVRTHPNTIAGGLADVLPQDRDAALVALRNGERPKQFLMKKYLRLRGFSLPPKACLPSHPGVTSFAGLIKLLDEGVAGRDETVGSGLEDPEAVMKTFKEAPTIKPSTEEFEKLRI